MVHNHFQLHLDEGHLLLGGDDQQGAVLHLAGHVGLLPGEGLCAVEVEAAKVHKGGVHSLVGTSNWSAEDLLSKLTLKSTRRRQSWWVLYQIVDLVQIQL